jgi:hypothetical protein
MATSTASEPPAESLRPRRASSSTNSSGSDVDPEGVNPLNISLESDHLNAEEKAAHEADTLPMDGAPPPMGGGARDVVVGNARRRDKSKIGLKKKEVFSKYVCQLKFRVPQIKITLFI